MFTESFEKTAAFSGADESGAGEYAPNPHLREDIRDLQNHEVKDLPRSILKKRRKGAKHKPYVTPTNDL